MIPTGDEKYEIRVTTLTLVPIGEPLFSEMATNISLEDEVAGEFVVIRQSATRCGVRIDKDEWPHLKKCVDFLIGQARDNVE